MNAISLFTGAGGLDVGFERAGFSTVFANEFDHDAAESWRINRPENAHNMIEGDIGAHIEELHKFIGADIVFGGPPCQGFSVAGKMDPNDSRSQLIWRFMDAIDIVRPKVFVMENVSALGKLTKWEQVRKKLKWRGESADYNVSFRVHCTADYGVPENRDRMIFIGVRRDIGSVDRFYEILNTHIEKPVTAREVILSVGKFDSADNPKTCTANVTLASHPVMRRSPYAGMLVNGAGRPINLDSIVQTLPASMGGNKTPIVDEIALNNAKIPNWFATYHDGLIKGTMTPHESNVPPTIRRLTIKECAAIQTFPSKYKFSGKKSKQYMQIGNAVPCRFAEAVATSVRDAYLEGC